MAEHNKYSSRVHDMRNEILALNEEIVRECQGSEEYARYLADSSVVFEHLTYMMFDAKKLKRVDE